MGIFYDEWTPLQREVYDLKNRDVTAFAVAFCVALTQHLATTMTTTTTTTLASSSQRSAHTATDANANLLLTLAVSVILWSLLVDVFAFVLDPDSEDGLVPVVYRIVTPLVAFGGFPLHAALRRRRRRAARRVLVEIQDEDGDFENDNDNDNEDAAVRRREGGGGGVAASHDDSAASVSSDAAVIAPLLPPEDRSPSATTTTRRMRRRVPFVGNLKVFLTNLVIVHHAACCVSNTASFFFVPVKSPDGNQGDLSLQLLLGIDQSYFMNLFFFLSGYFVPGSFDRKGPRAFLKDRAIRLGIPFAVWTFVAGPFFFVGSQYLLLYRGDEPFNDVVCSSGPQWFVVHLMVFDVAYAVFCGRGWMITTSRRRRIPCPSLLGFLGIACGLGSMSGILSTLFPPDGSFAFVPLFWNEYPSYVVFFFGGAVAARNGWIEQDLKDKDKISRKVVYLWAVASLASMMLAGPVLARPSRYRLNRLYIGFFLFGGTSSVSLSLAVIVFFLDRSSTANDNGNDNDHESRNDDNNNNNRFFVAEAFEKSAYTAYLLHMAFPLQIATKCLILALESTGGGGVISYVVDDEGDGRGGLFREGHRYYIEDGNLVLPGFMLVALVALTITWPISHLIRSLPGFSKVL